MYEAPLPPITVISKPNPLSKPKLVFRQIPEYPTYSIDDWGNVYHAIHHPCEQNMIKRHEGEGRWDDTYVRRRQERLIPKQDWVWIFYLKKKHVVPVWYLMATAWVGPRPHPAAFGGPKNDLWGDYSPENTGWFTAAEYIALREKIIIENKFSKTPE